MKDFADYLYELCIKPIVQPIETAAIRAERFGFLGNVFTVVVSVLFLYVTGFTAPSWMTVYVVLHLPADILAAKYAWDAEHDDDDDGGPWGWVN